MSRKMMVRFGLAAVAMLLLVGMTVAPVAGGGPTPNATSAAGAEAVFPTIYIYGSTNVDQLSNLPGYWPAKDTFTLYCMVTRTVRVRLDDCCLQGDALCYVPYVGTSPNTKAAVCKKSPNDVVRYLSCVPGRIFRFDVGYVIPHTNVFPAGYTAHIGEPY